MIRKSSLFLFVVSLVTSNIQILLIFLFFVVLFFIFEKCSIKLVLKRTLFIFPPLLGVLLLNKNVFIVIFLRAVISLMVLSILTQNFDIGKVAHTLKRFKIPNYLVDLLVLTLRYSYSLADEVAMVKKNLYLRGCFKKTHIFQSEFLGPVVGNLFVRSVKKSERVHTAMKLRGY